MMCFTRRGGRPAPEPGQSERSARPHLPRARKSSASFPPASRAQELFAEVGDGLTGRRRRIVGVFEPPLLQQRSDTPCPMLPWSSCFNQGRLLTRSPRCCATERVPC